MILVLSAAALVLASLFATWVTRSITRPIHLPPGRRRPQCRASRA
ncbi:hypothetical protein ACCUM_3342 [Candidatus Accumulibacter phosphatis]|uniref:Uncharacterized protein n=1 Tax=Candidatus Accumulibacter phosphatis TaxID=327160 RepID=A0A5S4EPS9_9PROT|nr:hypothetical protein ACCUM_3342 [Candidatus Accumulibacter phosphatis]